MKDKILGCLVAAAAGDAMGAATETRTRKQIEEKFGGYVTEFLAPPPDTFARGNEPGQITDDFSVAYMTCEEILRNNGAITTEIAKKALLDWSSADRYFTRFAGPTTRAAIIELKGGSVMRPEGFTVVNDNERATNGAAMKTAPIALFSKGNIDKAIKDCITACAVTHPNNIALSGAAAVAAVTAAALAPDASICTVVQAGLYGAAEGDRIGRRDYNTVAGASIEKRIRFAVQLATLANDLNQAIDDIGDYIGSGLMASEAVPAAFGLMVAAKGDTVKAIEAAVNIGNDTDTVATIVGGMVGTLNGVSSMPDEWLLLMEKANEINLSKMADQIWALG